MDIVERFINYTKFDTQSAEDSSTVPSTSKQLIFAKYLKEELEREGLQDVEMDDMGYIYATLPGNTKKDAPTIGFISHYDTALDASGANIKARVVNNYDGGDIVLSEGIVSSPKKFPELLAHKGEGIAVVVELLKLQYTALVVNWCVHNRAAKLLLFILKGRSLCRENEKQVEIFCASSKFIYFCRKRKKKQ